MKQAKQQSISYNEFSLILTIWLICDHLCQSMLKREVNLKMLENKKKKKKKETIKKKIGVRCRADIAHANKPFPFFHYIID